jgi:hypothetical protein
MIQKLSYKPTTLWVLLLLMFSCSKNVEDGYRIDYPESEAQLTVTPVSNSRGAIGDSVYYTINATSNFNIKSIVVTSSISGGSKSGFKVLSGGTDPLVDHIFGTIQKNTKAFSLLYRYVVTQDSVDVSIDFQLIDEKGQKTMTLDLITVPKVVNYDSIVLYTNSSSNTDGFATYKGALYRNLTRYTSLNDTNRAIQKSIDIIFLVNGVQARLVGSYDGSFATTDDFIKNKTLFKVHTDISSTEFDNLNNAKVSIITGLDSLTQYGTTNVNVKVGDIVTFKTDYGSVNSSKSGIIRINSIHPTSCSWYTGDTYLLEMDVFVQKK